MENKINITELLKYCPKGMELYSPIFGEVYLYTIRPHLAIVVTTKEPGDFKEEFLYDGRYGMNGECMLFPSRGKTTWEGFVPPCQFNDGDIVATDRGRWLGIIKNKYDFEYYTVHCAIDYTFNDTFYRCGEYCFSRLATEEEKEKLFKAIKDNGYKWNAETKTLEKLPKFKVGDKITNGKTSITIGYIDDEYYYEVGRNIATRLFIKNQDEWNLIPKRFDITTLKPFESRVLVRDYDMKMWIPYFFGCLDNSNECPYMVVGGLRWKCCIPYEGNEHLIGKCDDCTDFYKNWE